MSDVFDVNVIKTARSLVEKGWCQNNYSEDAMSNPVAVSDPMACKFCLSGSIGRAIGWSNVGEEDLLITELFRAYNKLVLSVINGSEKNPFGSLWTWNDYPNRTQKHVIEVLDKTIERLEKVNVN